MPTALVAMANFKGTLSNQEATSIVSHALHDLGFTVVELPIGDGGFGTRSCLHSILGGEIKRIGLSDVLYFPNAKTPEWIYIESPETCGRAAVLSHGETAVTASSFRLGECLNEIFDTAPKSLKKIYIGLGDSGISDAGIGMLSELGYQLFDSYGLDLDPTISEMDKLFRIRPPENRPWEKYEITVLCDVKNPLCGPNGSAQVFSPQKGATPAEVAQIEVGMAQTARIFGKDVANTTHCGSAGGLASAFFACLNARLVPGAKHLFEWIRLQIVLKDADLVITGEGKTDAQTLSGKATFELLEQADSIPTYFISGSLGAGYEALVERENLAGIYECGTTPDAKTALYEKVRTVFGGN